MVDVLTKKQRSHNMSMIKSRNTRPELIIRKLLSLNGIRGYRINYKLVGKPDIVFTKYKLAVFIDGCFWHKCPQCFKQPENNKEFWEKKIEGNVRRDKTVNNKLRKDGWKVLRFWEHLLRKDNISVYKMIYKELKSREY